MESLDLADVSAYVEKNIKTFHEARIAKIHDLSLKALLKGKNPYLFKAKDTKDAEQLIRSILDAFLSSGEETMFGNFLEELAIFINGKVYGGHKAGVPGIDLDFVRDGTRYLVSIKSNRYGEMLRPWTRWYGVLMRRSELFIPVAAIKVVSSSSMVAVMALMINHLRKRVIISIAAKGFGRLLAA